MLALYRGLPPTGQALLLGGMRRSAIDGACTVLGVVDNASKVCGAEASFELSYDGRRVNDTQEYFLEACQADDG